MLTFDPYAHTESFSSSFLHHIYEPLMRRDADLDFEPTLATSWEVVEPTAPTAENVSPATTSETSRASVEPRTDGTTSYG